MKSEFDRRDSVAYNLPRLPTLAKPRGEMIVLRPAEETLNVALSVLVAAVAVASATHAWVAGSLFGIFFFLRFALQPPVRSLLTRRRRAFLALCGCATIACVVWAIGVRVAHWPG